MDLQDQVALITGAGRGIGKAIALRLARDGADIAIFDLNDDWAQATANEIEQLGRRAFHTAVDVSGYDQVQDGVARAVEALGKIDIVVNNAGIGQGQRFLDITQENWERHLNIHLSGSFYCAQAAGRDMAKRNYGRIINIASVAGMMGPISMAPYGTAKAGIIGLTRAASLDLADLGITVNAIAPGPIDTELLHTWPEEALKERAQHLPIARFGQPEEIAHMAAFLASPDSGFITGTVMVVDGGSVAAGAYMVEKYRRRKARGTS